MHHIGFCRTKPLGYMLRFFYIRNVNPYDNYIDDTVNIYTSVSLTEKLKNKMTTPEVVAQIRYETGMDFAVDESKRTTAEQASYMKLHVE